MPGHIGSRRLSSAGVASRKLSSKVPAAKSARSHESEQASDASVAIRGTILRLVTRFFTPLRRRDWRWARASQDEPAGALKENGTEKCQRRQHDERYRFNESKIRDLSNYPRCRNSGHQTCFPATQDRSACSYADSKISEGTSWSSGHAIDSGGNRALA